MPKKIEMVCTVYVEAGGGVLLTDFREKNVGRAGREALQLNTRGWGLFVGEAEVEGFEDMTVSEADAIRFVAMGELP